VIFGEGLIEKGKKGGGEGKINFVSHMRLACREGGGIKKEKGYDHTKRRWEKKKRELISIIFPKQWER